MSTEQSPIDSSTESLEASRPLGRRMAAVGSVGLLATAATAAAVASGVGVAGAATLTVTNCNDTGAGSLRQAIIDAAAAGPDTITITATCTAASPVNVGSVMVIGDEGPLSIVGPGAAQFVLDGGGAVQIMDINMGDNDALSISGMTFQNASAPEDGGAIRIAEVGAFTLTNSVFSGNEAADEGGALYFNAADSVDIIGCTFENNSAQGGGALYFLASEGPITITNSTFLDNTATVYKGGAISVYENPNTFLLANSTLTGNSAATDGGAVYLSLYDDASFLFNTIVDNSADNAGGIYVAGQGGPYVLELQGNIISGNTGTTNNDQVHVGSGFSVFTVSNDYHGTVSGFVPDNSDLNVDPQLQPLAANGGPTMTMALLQTSPVVDKGPGPETVDPFPGSGFDQRETPFLRVYNGRADIGAFEWQPPAEPPAPEPVVPSFTG